MRAPRARPGFDDRFREAEQLRGKAWRADFIRELLFAGLRKVNPRGDANFFLLRAVERQLEPHEVKIGFLALLTLLTFLPNSNADSSTVFEQPLKKLRPEFYTFQDESSAKVSLSQYFQPNRPVILTFVYYECPKLCNLLLNGLVESLKTSSLVPGKDFEFVAISINPKETPPLAKAKRATYLKAYGNLETREGWHFLVGDAGAIRSLTQEMGFQFSFNPRTQIYDHPAVLFVLSPGGQISSYLYGISFQSKDLSSAIKKARNQSFWDVRNRILLSCARIGADSISQFVLIMWVTLGSITLLGWKFYGKFIKS